MIYIVGASVLTALWVAWRASSFRSNVEAILIGLVIGLGVAIFLLAPWYLGTGRGKRK